MTPTPCSQAFAHAGIAIGGDVFPGSTLSDHCLRYQNIPDIKLIVVLGELGGHDEYSLVDALKAGHITKPVVAWVSGTCAKLFKSEVQFGHAGAKSGGASESAQVRLCCMGSLVALQSWGHSRYACSATLRGLSGREPVIGCW